MLANDTNWDEYKESVEKDEIIVKQKRSASCMTFF